MNTNKKSKIVSYFLIFIFLFAAAGWYLMQSRSDKKDKDTGKSFAKSSSHIQVEDGVTTIELSPSELANSGITTIKLIQTKHQAQLTAYGTVVSIQDLSKDVQSFAAGKAQLAKAKESLLVSQKNFERTKSIYEKKLTSDKDFQSSQAAFLSDQADVNSASANLNSLRSSIAERWGGKLSKWIFDDSPELQRLFSLNYMLIQISLPTEESDFKVPDNIFIQATKQNKKILCRFVSAGYLANSQFQTKTLYYISPGASLSGGMNVKAFLPAGKNLSGVIVPSESIVWYQGKAWIYAEKIPDKFIRVEVDNKNPAGEGYFIPDNNGVLKPGVTIVKNGVQLLLSEELTPAQVQSGGGKEGDND